MANWEEKTFSDGRTFVSADILTCGDYGGAGSVGRANIDALMAGLKRAACKVDEALEDVLDEMSNDDLWECYRTAMEATNTYPEAEYNSVYVNVDRITQAFVDAVREKLAK